MTLAPHMWPRQMRAETAARYCDEASVDAFMRSIPQLYPKARDIPGKGKRWLIEELDAAIDRNHHVVESFQEGGMANLV